VIGPELQSPHDLIRSIDFRMLIRVGSEGMRGSSFPVLSCVSVSASVGVMNLMETKIRLLHNDYLAALQ